MISAQTAGMPVASLVSDEDIQETEQASAIHAESTMNDGAKRARPEGPDLIIGGPEVVEENESVPLSPQSPWGHFVDLFADDSPTSVTSGPQTCPAVSPSSSSDQQQPYPLKRQCKRRKLIPADKTLDGFFLELPKSKPSPSSPTPIDDAEAALQHLSF